MKRLVSLVMWLGVCTTRIPVLRNNHALRARFTRLFAASDIHDATPEDRSCKDSLAIRYLMAAQLRQPVERYVGNTRPEAAVAPCPYQKSASS
jgi:hypothetical protein